MSPNDELEILTSQPENMSQRIWDQLKRDSVELKVELRELLFSDPKHAVFRADYSRATENVREVDVRLFLEDGRYPGERVNRFFEATYFEHPHILRYFEAGTLLSNEGTVTYAVTERAGTWASRSLGTEKALGFAQHVMSGLEYLHTRNLVYCVLSPHTVVPVDTNWKLSDFRQLRVAGTDTSDEALSLAATLDTCPPEAAEGLISPAWDVWSFGQTLRKVLTGYKAHMPDPFRAVFLACLNVNPSSRPTLNQLSGLLETTRLSSREPGISTAATA
jgi:serine/threonine protein kinase